MSTNNTSPVGVPQSSASAPSSLNNFMDLPTELHLAIVSNLQYPDALALKISHPYFNSLVTSSTLTIQSRVSWLLDRADRNLPLPKSQNLKLNNDHDFVNNEEVTAILRRRRNHVECGEHWLRTLRRRAAMKELGPSVERYYEKECEQHDLWKDRCLINSHVRMCSGIREIVQQIKIEENSDKKQSKQRNLRHSQQRPRHQQLQLLANRSMSMTSSRNLAPILHAFKTLSTDMRIVHLLLGIIVGVILSTYCHPSLSTSYNASHFSEALSRQVSRE